MKILTHELTPEDNLPAFSRHQIYCGLDSAITLEVFEEIIRDHGGQIPKIYNFERAIQAPYLEIMNRGFLVDESSRRHAMQQLEERKFKLETTLNRLAFPVWDKGLNARSPQQLKDFFYKQLRLPEIYIRQKGESKLSTNREALEKLEEYLYARPFISCILSIRDITKQLSVFGTQIDFDGRFRTSYNIAGTETGRPSSSENAMGTGGNHQNVAPSLRYVFIADKGKRLCVVDLEQVEARDVGFFCGCLFDDWTFLDACESGDLHTNNAKLIWPELPWTGNPKDDKEIANRQFYREFSYRDMAKKGGHLSNYSGTAYTAARSLKVPQGIMEEFQARYCRGRISNPRRNIGAIKPAYACIPRWWGWTAEQLQTIQFIETPFGRKRYFFGRPDDPATLREAIAFLPQSTTADRMNLGLWKVWKHMPQVQLLAQTYDSITFQYSEREDEDEIIREVLDRIRVELVSPSGRRYIVPGEAKVGWNWGNYVGEEDVERARKSGKKIPRLNLDGLKKWKPGVKDSRERHSGLQTIWR